MFQDDLSEALTPHRIEGKYPENGIVLKSSIANPSKYASLLSRPVNIPNDLKSDSSSMEDSSDQQNQNDTRFGVSFVKKHKSYFNSKKFS